MRPPSRPSRTTTPSCPAPSGRSWTGSPWPPAAADGPGAERDALAAFARTELLPHAAAEERTIYLAAARRSGRPPARRRDARRARRDRAASSSRSRGRGRRSSAAAYGRGAAGALRQPPDQGERASCCRCWRATRGVGRGAAGRACTSCWARTPATTTARTHGARPAHEPGAPAAAACNCGHEHSAALPGARRPGRTPRHPARHDLRRARARSRLGGGLVLDRAARPAAAAGARSRQREPGGFAVEYLERGPEAWRLVFTRLPADPRARLVQDRAT